MPVERLGIVGAGTMGSGIAEVAIRQRFPVILYDVEEKFVAAARDRIRAGLERWVRREGGDATDALRSRLTLTARLDDLATCDCIIEAAPEDLILKRDLFGRLDRLAAPDAILASNTSSLSITALGAATGRPAKTVGMHFFNPASVMALVEVIPGAQTSSQTVDAVLALARALGKTPVRAKDTPGFIVNRVARPFYLEALRLLARGAAPAGEIDRIMRLAGGFRMGPFELLDLIGLDVNLAVTRAIYEAAGRVPRFRPQSLQEQMVVEGRLGRKCGRGFYEYDDAGRRRLAPSPAAPAGTPPGSLIVLGEGPLADGFRGAARGSGWIVDGGGSGSSPAADVFADFRTPIDRIAAAPSAAGLSGREALWLRLALTGLPVEGSVGFATLPPWNDRALVEIIPRSDTNPQAVAAAQGVFRGLGKETAVVQAPGGVFPRILAMIVNEVAYAIMEDVAAPADIDTAMCLGANYPHGPLALADDIGLDTLLMVLEALREHEGELYRPAPLLAEMVGAGKVGRAAGGGFYSHAGRGDG